MALTFAFGREKERIREAQSHSDTHSHTHTHSAVNMAGITHCWEGKRRIVWCD